MSTATLDELRYKREDTTHRTIAVALVLSVLMHLALLWSHLSIRVLSPETEKLGHGAPPLTVELAPPPLPPTPPARPVIRPPAPAHLPPRPLPRLRPPAIPRVQPPRPIRRPEVARRPPRPRPQPPVLALKKPPEESKPTLRSFTVPSAPTVPAQRDLSSYIAAKRREREIKAAQLAQQNEPKPKPPETANERADRLAAANLAMTSRNRAFGYDPKHGGGIFSIRELGYDYATFMFYGWNKDMSRDTAQLIEVRKGNAPNIRIAVIQKMISIIREYERGNFLWESYRLGRTVTLSAKPEYNAQLQSFLMKEFFGNGPP